MAAVALIHQLEPFWDGDYWGLLGITGDYWGWGIPTNHPCMEATAFTFGHEKHDLNTVSGGVNNNFDS